MSYYLFQPDAPTLSRAGYASVSKVPAVFSPNWSYHQEASRYLREKAHQELGLQSRAFKQSLPTRRTLVTYGQSLCNFFEWCDAREQDWRDVDFAEHILAGYQTDMLRGTWSVRGTSLRPRTVNLRVTVVCEFLSWAASRGLRGDFSVQGGTHRVKRQSYSSPRGFVAQDVFQRLARVRPPPSQLRIPTDGEIQRWREEIAVRFGKTKLLMADLVLATGIRREEVAQWHPDTLPRDRNEWRIRGDYVTVTIEEGTKGSKHVGSEDRELGPARCIDIPLSLAQRIHRYRTFDRPAQAAKYVKSASDATSRKLRSKQLAHRLFLTDVSGAPVSGNALYEAWTTGARQPFKGWTIHGGRHYWACKTLMERVGQVWRACADAYDLTTSATDVLLLHIQPQLGHVSSSTSQQYLVWLERMFVGTDVYEQYAASLETITEQ